ncbi:MAG: DNA recombination protein RmuC [Bacteroidetes bacterium]|jgi:DNA recombination protein RmuC|nr:DNA recombination protein RmuC [Bacteroidota bacterium]
MEVWIPVITILLGLVVGFFIGKNISKATKKAELNQLEEQNNQLNNQLAYVDKQIEHLKAEHQQEIDELKTERERIRQAKDEAQNQLTKTETEYKNLQEKLDTQKQEVENLQEKFTKEFENLANKILDQKSQKFTTSNKENIEQILNPLKEKIKTFEEKVQKNQDNFNEKNTRLDEVIKRLNDENRKMSEEAEKLTKALKGESKTQGNWGELILERVLEKSGLTKGREYEVQQSYQDESGQRYMPDVIINLPNDKQMVIDSKVSLTAYERYVNTEDEKEKTLHLKAHLNSLKNHIKQLSAKNYQDLGYKQSPDFVLMFIPVEPALYLAQNEDQNFYYSAFKDNILLVSPTTLLSTLRTVDMIWSNEKQQQNANEIAHHAGNLYDKFSNLLDELETLGNRIKSTDKAYTSAMKKLTGNQNLVKDVVKLQKLGIKTTKEISPKWIKKAEADQLEEGES